LVKPVLPLAVLQARQNDPAPRGVTAAARPCRPDIGFEGETPTGRLLATVMPWMKERRPALLIRLRLFL